ncbi:MAG: TIGR01212 family radical SAM protein [Clostridia bacterium]|nr:TIGR01212 family radical SAM protein [Clostridia bacterium]
MEFFNGKRYRTLDYEMKRLYGSKVVKLSVDGGFTCPNRVNGGGCIFCTEQGSSEFTGDHSGKRLSITQQLECQREIMSQKWQSDKYIAYFQSYTNTFAPVSVLKARYDEALATGVMGLAIATRPDCLGDDVLELLASYRCPLWVELGLQSITCHHKLNRGYPNEVYVDAAKRLRKHGIPFVTHVIFGLPWESREEMLSTVRFAAQNGTWGIKLHMLYIDRTAPLGALYQQEPFHVLTLEEYADLVTEAIAILPPNVVVHRVTGDGKRENLIAPQWSRNKRNVLNTIDKMMVQKGYVQGCKTDDTTANE